MSIALREKLLFDEWRKQRSPFSADGLVDEASYLASKIKLLFILKETNDTRQDYWDLRQFLRDGSRSQTWNNITRWTMGIRRIGDDLNWKNDLRDIDEEMRIKFTRSIGAMNLKKSCGGHTTDNKSFVKVAKDDLDLSKRQFYLYKPDLVVCCGSVTWGLVEDIADPDKEKPWRMTSRGIDYYEYDPGKFVICYSHPEARVQASILYYGLIDAVREILTKK